MLISLSGRVGVWRAVEIVYIMLRVFHSTSRLFPPGWCNREPKSPNPMPFCDDEGYAPVATVWAEAYHHYIFISYSTSFASCVCFNLYLYFCLYRQSCTRVKTKIRKCVVFCSPMKSCAGKRIFDNLSITLVHKNN